MNLSVLVSLLTGGGILAFVQFLIKRHDERSDKTDSVTIALNNLGKQVSAINDRLDLEQAVTARVRILRVSDECRREVSHSLESLNQTLDDINTYRNFCEDHPSFKNRKAELAISNIEQAYERHLQNNDFL